MVTCVPGGRARSALAGGPGARFADVRWVAETGSTNADAMELARQGEPEGIVLVADHQTAGRGRAGRTLDGAAGSRVAAVGAAPSARAGGRPRRRWRSRSSAAAAVASVAGFSPRLKWPNDLVWPGDGSAPDRKLAGILAEADWPAGSAISAGWKEPAAHDRAVVVVGIGINVAWPDELPDELADIAVAINHVVDDAGRSRGPADRAARGARPALRRAGARGTATALLAEWRSRSATLGRMVRVDLGTDDVEGKAVDVTDDGHLVVETLEGAAARFAVGDVVHLR